MAIFNCGNIKVFYDERHDGGGTEFYKSILEVFDMLKVPKQKTICEWCAGPGFIGFSLFDKDYCEHLTLVDCNPNLQEGIDKTIKENNLENKVDFFCYNDLNEFSVDKKWNIVVSNPPHFSNKSDMKFDNYLKDQIINYMENIEILLLKALDKDFNLHRRFFSSVNEHLDKDGVIILFENKLGSDPTDFHDMLKDNGFVIRKILNSKTSFYMLFIMRESDNVPNWMN